MFPVVILISLLSGRVNGHGRMIDPPQRSSLFRYAPPEDGPFTPNYNDMELFCGGFARQVANGGKCGTCGDPYDIPAGMTREQVRKNEAGGIYATGYIAKTYTEGDIITVTIDLTASHLGNFEFRICPHNDVNTPVSQKCLDQHVLELETGGTKWKVTKTGVFDINLILPKGLTCSQCVLQWYYKAGNSWGVDPDGTECTGCGDQETFVNCADVRIISAVLPTTQKPLTTDATTTTEKVTQSPITTKQPC